MHVVPEKIFTCDFIDKFFLHHYEIILIIIFIIVINVTIATITIINIIIVVEFVRKD